MGRFEADGLIRRRPWGSLVLCLLLAGCGGGGSEDGEEPGGSDLDREDPFFSKQWYLENKGGEYGVAGADLKARGAWDAGVTGRGTTIAVIDNGFDLEHEDLRDRWRQVPYPDSELATADLGFETHGTMVAGVVGAAGRNQKGIRGLAFESTLIPMHFGESTSLSRDASLFRIAVDNGADIVTNSWGIHAAAVPDVFRSAFEYVNTAGRGGKGGLILFSAGNSGGPIFSVLAASPEVLAIGATTEDDERAQFSSFGQDLDLMAPAGWDLGLWTTDVRGRKGYNVGTFAPGSYKLGVFWPTNFISPYEIRLGAATADVTEVEPNNRPNQGQSLDLSNRVLGTTDAGNPFAEDLQNIQDWYAISIQSGKDFRARITGTSHPGVGLLMADANGNLLTAVHAAAYTLTALGDEKGDYTSAFGGTSGACPLAAGVVALILSANPALNRNQVIDILIRSADKIDPANAAYDAQGHSTHYGYGRVNAARAVQMAKTTAAVPLAKTTAPVWKRAAKPTEGGLYWYSGGKANPLRLETGEVFVRTKRRTVQEGASAKERSLAVLGATAQTVSLGRDPAAYEKAFQAETNRAPALYDELGQAQWLGNDLVMGLEPGTSLEALHPLLATHQLELQEAFASGEYRLRSPLGPLAALKAANALYESGRVRYAHPDFQAAIELH